MAHSQTPTNAHTRTPTHTSAPSDSAQCTTPPLINVFSSELLCAPKRALFVTYESAPCNTPPLINVFSMIRTSYQGSKGKRKEECGQGTE